MSLTRKIAHNTGVQIAGKVVSTALGLLAIGMMTRYLGTEQFGWYITTITFLQVVAILVDFGLIPVTAQMLGEGKIKEKTLVQNLLGFRLVTSVIFLGIAPLIALLFPYPPVVKMAIALSSISFISIALNQIFIGLFQYKLKMHLHAIAENVGRIMLVAGLYIVIVLEQGFLPVMIAVIVSNLSFTVALFVLGRRQTTIGFAFDLAIWKTIAIKMWPIAVSIMFNVVYLNGDTIILSLYGSQTEVGLYGAAYRVINILSQIAMMVMGVMLPLMAAAWVKKDTTEFNHKFQMSFDAMMLFAVPVTIGLFFLATPIITLVAGQEFVGAGLPLSLLSFAVFSVFLGAIFGHAAVAIDRQKETLPIYISNAAITLIGYFIFIPRYGMIGAAGMTIFSELYTAIFLWLRLRSYHVYTLRTTVLLKILFSGIVMGIIVYLLQGMIHVLLVATIGAIVYGVQILLTRAISKETLQDILRIERS